MRELVGWASAAEEAVVLTTGLANAGYFAQRAIGSGPPKRLGAALLAALYAGTAGLAVAMLAGDLEDGVPGLLLRAPLVIGNAVTCVLILMGGRR